MYEFVCGPLPFGGESDDQIELFRAILEAPVRFPGYVKDQDAINMLTNLLERIPELRLGSSSYHAKEIQAHAYYKEFDFDAVAGGYMEAPWQPNAEVLKSAWEPVAEKNQLQKVDDVDDDMSDFGSISGDEKEKDKHKVDMSWTDVF